MSVEDKVKAFYYDPLTNQLILIFGGGDKWSYQMTAEAFEECLNSQVSATSLVASVRHNFLVGTKVL